MHCHARRGVVYTLEDWHSGQVQLDPDVYNEERLEENLLIATPKSFHYYINHSCEPNVIDQSHHPNWTHYITLRDIHANEEIIADYIAYGEELIFAHSQRYARQAPT